MRPGKPWTWNLWTQMMLSTMKFGTQCWDRSDEAAKWTPHISRDSHPGKEPGTTRPRNNKRKGRKRSNQVRYCPQQTATQRQIQGPTLWSSWNAKTPLKCLILSMLLVLCRSTTLHMLNSNLPAHKGYGCYLKPQPRLTPSWTHPLPGRWDGNPAFPRAGCTASAICPQTSMPRKSSRNLLPLIAPQLLQQTISNAKTPSQKSGFPQRHGKLPLQDRAYPHEYSSMDALYASNPMSRLCDNAQIVSDLNMSLTGARRQKSAQSVPGKSTMATAPNFVNIVSPPTTLLRILNAPDGKQNEKSRSRWRSITCPMPQQLRKWPPCLPHRAGPGTSLPLPADCNVSLSARNLSSDFPCSSPYPWNIYQPGRPYGHYCPSLHGL